jgi:hypothetical protein
MIGARPRLLVGKPAKLKLRLHSLLLITKLNLFFAEKFVFGGLEFFD